MSQISDIFQNSIYSSLDLSGLGLTVILYPQDTTEGLDLWLRSRWLAPAASLFILLTSLLT